MGGSCAGDQRHRPCPPIWRSPGQRSFDLGDLVLRFLHRELRAETEDDGQLSFDGENDAAAAEALVVRAKAVIDLADVLDAELEQRGGTGCSTTSSCRWWTSWPGWSASGSQSTPSTSTTCTPTSPVRSRAPRTQAYAVVGREFNLGSPKQLQVILFDELGLPKTKKIKTGYTTDADALQWLYAQTEHPLLEIMLRHRDVARLLVTVEGLEQAGRRRRPDPHHLQPDRGRDRAAVLHRPQPAEHPDPHRRGPRHPRRPSSSARATSAC